MDQWHHEYGKYQVSTNFANPGCWECKEKLHPKQLLNVSATEHVSITLVITNRNLQKFLRKRAEKIGLYKNILISPMFTVRIGYRK